ncbi:MAG TPA: hypothetical protein VMU70_00310 [Candidatus Tyrphobacter sp.]|nr:hypothetical protein [Candidatus Tyrphobacter sp.]
MKPLKIPRLPKLKISSLSPKPLVKGREALGLDNRSAITLFATVESPLEETKILGEPELEDILSRTAWGFFEANREALARELNLEPLDLLLGDARIVGLRLNKKELGGDEEFWASLSKPIGSLKLKFCFSFVKRGAAPEEALAYEPGGLRAYLVNEQAKTGEIVYIETNNESTSVYHAESSGLLRLNSFDWGLKTIIQSLGGLLTDDEEINNSIYLRYIENEVSPSIKKRLDGVFDKVFGTFVNGAAMSAQELISKRDLLPPVYFFSHFPMPTRIFRRKVSFLSKEVKLRPVSAIDPVTDFLNYEKVLAFEGLSRMALKKIKWLMA